ncbi:UNVERIFIED_CONTAM: hypothetical protein PYX00_004847 [Menopon gallinae]|uniref:Coactosin-like protein n=1 Tax=Menopon gallinae TaxID=328185 RepID=A0AAW2I838_9NEOP
MVQYKKTAFNLGTVNFWWKYFTDMLVDQMLTEHVRNFTVPKHTSIDASAVKAAYEDVRSDSTDTKWAVLKYEGTTIIPASKGTDFQDFKRQFGDNERCYGYIRLQTGDEMSKRTKFILITWVGRNVGVMHRAKVTNDKSLVKEIITGYATEFQIENSSELDETFFVEELSKIGGTKYGTGVVEMS